MLVTEQSIVEFANRYDPQPFHLDSAVAAHHVFAGLAASGLHTASMTMRLLVDAGVFSTEGTVAGLGIELEWPAPTRPGDVLHVCAVVESITPSKRKTDQGVVVLRCTTLTRSGEPRQEMKAKVMLFKRTW